MCVCVSVCVYVCVCVCGVRKSVCVNVRIALFYMSVCWYGNVCVLIFSKLMLNGGRGTCV